MKSCEIRNVLLLQLLYFETPGKFLHDKKKPFIFFVYIILTKVMHTFYILLFIDEYTMTLKFSSFHVHSSLYCSCKRGIDTLIERIKRIMLNNYRCMLCIDMTRFVFHILFLTYQGTVNTKAFAVISEVRMYKNECIMNCLQDCNLDT